jgi:hypothetical protein
LRWIIVYKLCHPANTVVVAQIKQAKIKIQIVLKLPLNPKSALKPLASFKLGSMTSVTAGGVRSENNTGLNAW